MKTTNNLTTKKTSIMKNLFLLLASVLIFSCSNDDVIEPVAPTPTVVYDYTIHERINEPTDTLKFIFLGSSGTIKALSEKRLSDNTTIDFLNLSQSNISEIKYFDLANLKGINKTISYDNGIGNFARITNIVTEYRNIVGNMAINYKKEKEIFTYSNNYKTITIQKQQLNTSTDAVIIEEIFVVNIKFIPDPNIIGLQYLAIDNIKNNTTGITTYYTYDDYYNVYKKIQSIDKLVLSNWETLKITHNNIIKEVQKNSNNQVINEKIYTCSYDTKQNCLQRKYNGTVIDKYVYKTE